MEKTLLLYQPCSYNALSPKQRGYFFIFISKIPITSAPYEPSLKLGMPHVFSRLADGRQTKPLKRGKRIVGLCFYSNGTAHSKVTACKSSLTFTSAKFICKHTEYVAFVTHTQD